MGLLARCFNRPVRCVVIQKVAESIDLPSMENLVRIALLCLLTAVSSTAAADELTDRSNQARAIAGQLVSQLGAALKAELSAGGPVSAIGVCKQTAPELAGKLSRDNGMRVARVSLRVRNPLLGQPDAWEQDALAGFDRAAAAGDKSATIEKAEIVNEPQGRYLRYIKAIPVQPLCLSCHGAPEALSAEVRERLTTDYPHDRATGYRVGDIRGGVTIKQRLP